MASPRALPALTGLRGLAALWVVAFHATGFLAEAPRGLDRRYLGVDLFFILSGYVLTHVYGDRLASGRMDEAMRFLGRRIARLWPVWLAALGLFAAKAEIGRWTGLGGDASRVGDDPSTWIVFALLVQSWGWVDPERLNPPGWSLSYEWAASLLFPALAVAVARLRSRAAAAVLAGGCLALVAAWCALRGLPTLHAHAAFGVRAGAEFLAGVLIFRAWPPDDAGRWPSLLSSPWPWLVALAGTLVVLPRHLGVELGAVATFALLVPASCRADGALVRVLAHPWLLGLGERSCALYATHWLVVETLWNLFPRLSAPVADGFRLGFFVATLCGAGMLASAMYRCVEAPARRGVQAWVARGLAGRNGV